MVGSKILSLPSKVPPVSNEQEETELSASFKTGKTEIKGSEPTVRILATRFMIIHKVVVPILYFLGISFLYSLYGKELIHIIKDYLPILMNSG